MSSSYGENFRISIFGESHAAAIGVTMEGLPAGSPIDSGTLQAFLERRAPGRDAFSTSRREADAPEFLCGVKNGVATGAPITAIIRNADTRSNDYASLANVPRPGHADYPAEVKFGGFQDRAGGGHFSGRLTAPLVAAGAIVASALAQKGIVIGTHIHTLAQIKDRAFQDLNEDIEVLKTRLFPVLDASAAKQMQSAIEDVANDGDSVGGILETAVTGLPAGVGEPWFDTVEGVLSHALFSIPAIKGVEFGAGFGFASMRGSEANDPFSVENGQIRTATNHNGGINGGITNGMPVLFRCAVKPTPSIFLPQTSVDAQTMREETLELKGRHDPAIIHRARAVVDAVTALVLYDLLAQRFGTDF